MFSKNPYHLKRRNGHHPKIQKLLNHFDLDHGRDQAHNIFGIIGFGTEQFIDSNYMKSRHSEATDI